MTLTATQTPAECGEDVSTIDDTRQAVKGDVRASVKANEALVKWFPDWVREKRQRAGWTQYDLGRISGMGRGAIAQYEQGRRVPGKCSVERLLDTFQITGSARVVTLLWFFGDA